jgi:hypothetical protein
MLASAPVIVRCIDALHDGGARDEQEQLFDVVSTPAGDFIVGRPGSDEPPKISVEHRAFAVRQDVARVFLA